jgi:hypothetical protein
LQINFFLEIRFPQEAIFPIGSSTSSSAPLIPLQAPVLPFGPNLGVGSCNQPIMATIVTPVSNSTVSPTTTSIVLANDISRTPTNIVAVRENAG